MTRSNSGWLPQVAGVGGPFNPATLDSVEGYLAMDPNNVDGCDGFTSRYEGAILLVKRGNCFFQAPVVELPLLSI